MAEDTRGAEPPFRTDPRSRDQSGTPISLRTYLQVLRRRKRVIVVVTLLSALLGALPALVDDAVYESTATVQASVLDREGLFASSEPSGQVNVFDRYQDLYSEIEILKSSPVRAAVVERFAEPPEFEDPEVMPVGVSDIVTITVHAGDPAVAADVANAYADVFVEDRRERTLADLLVKADELRSRSAEARAQLDEITQRLSSEELSPGEMTNLQLRQSSLLVQVQDYERRADELGVDAALRGRGTQVVEPAQLEMTPISPKPMRSATIGLVLGFLFSLGLALVIDTVQDRIGSEEDLAGVVPWIPVLAQIPEADLDDPPPPSTVLEAFRYLRTGVRIYGLNSSLRSVMVTSSVGNEGKSTVAAFLAQAMARAGDRVVLVDADLRRPALHTILGIPNDRGLSSLLVGDISLDDAIHFVSDGLAVITAGPSIQNPAEALGSERFGEVLESIVRQSDFTIVDSPPVLPVADALVAGQRVDGALVVGRMGLVRRRSLRDTMSRLEDAAVPVVGLVANCTEEDPLYGDYGPGGDEPPKSRIRRRTKPEPVDA